MKTFHLAILSVVLLLAVVLQSTLRAQDNAGQAPQASESAATPSQSYTLDEKTTLDSFDKKMSYMLGLNMANLVKNMPMTVEIDQQLLLRGLEEGLKDTSPLSVEARQQLGNEISGIVGDKIRQQQTEFAEKNVAYLNENKAKSGVTTTASGLQYRVLAGGSGSSPGPTDTVTVHYRARLIDGTEFDSSFSRNEPAKFPVNQVIPGWQEALQLMKKGAKWELVIPPNLAYGERGIPQVIPPNAVLVFEVELLEITPLQLQ